MKLIPISVTRMVGRQVLVARKNSPAILFGVGVTGVVTSTVLACRATLKMDEVLEDAENKKQLAETTLREHPSQYSQDDFEQDLKVLKVKTAIEITKLYAPAILVGTISIAALAGSHNILSRRNAALTAAYAGLDRAFKEYRQRVSDEYGEEKEREFRYGVSTETIQEDKESGIKKHIAKHYGNVTSEYARLFNKYSSRNWTGVPAYDWTFLSGIQMMCNDMLNARGHLFLNEVYDSLGLERSKAGAVVGWVKNGNGDGFVDFGIFDGGNFDRVFDFMKGIEGEICLDFNVDGVIYDQI